jgi:hypothetical protein
MKSRCLLAALFFFVALLYGPSLHAWQGATPQAALEEIATATKPEVIARHLPEPVQKSIEVLPKAQKQHVMEQLLEMKASQLGGYTIRPAHNSEGWELIDSKGDSKGKVKAANAFISGVDALLPLEIDLADGPQAFIVTMHLEGNEWRIDDFGPWEKNDLGLDKLVHQPTEMERNEAAVKEALSELMNALRQYAMHFPRNGFPSTLRVLTMPMEPEDPYMSKDPLLDGSFAADPLIKNGYQFRYLLTSVGDCDRSDFGSFEITAFPVEFGKTGSKNFLADCYRIHVTTQNRPATEEDPNPED